MQTPADGKNWRGGRSLTNVQDESEKQSIADEYIRRCYEVGLEVIAITDHVYLSKDFIPFLQTAIGNLSKKFGYEITLFSGFEFEADVGKGVHVLALFEPQSDLDELDHILTECGVSVPRITANVTAKSKNVFLKSSNAVVKRCQESSITLTNIFFQSCKSL
jgi:hypothetical protein